jgi:hypothetical protein
MAVDRSVQDVIDQPAGRDIMAGGTCAPTPSPPRPRVPCLPRAGPTVLFEKLGQVERTVPEVPVGYPTGDLAAHTRQRIVTSTDDRRIGFGPAR